MCRYCSLILYSTNLDCTAQRGKGIFLPGHEFVRKVAIETGIGDGLANAAVIQLLRFVNLVASEHHLYENARCVRCFPEWWQYPP